MKKHSKKSQVAVVRYRTPGTSVRRAVDLSGGLAQFFAGAKVFVKPNVVCWAAAGAFPKWGVITTSCVVEDMVRVLRALKDWGIREITIGEGPEIADPKARDISDALHRAGIDADQRFFESLDRYPARFRARYEGRPELDASFFKFE